MSQHQSNFPQKHFEKMTKAVKQHFSILDSKTIIDRWKTTEGRKIIYEIKSQTSSGKMELELEGIVGTVEYEFKCPPNKPLYDLRGIPLNFQIPNNFKFSEIYFDYASFIDKKVGGVIDFSGKSFNSVKFNDCSLNKVKTNILNLEETSFYNCFVAFEVQDHLIIMNTLFENSVIQEMDFNNCSLSGLTTINSEIWDCSFENTELINCKFKSSELHYAKFIDSTLDNCNFDNCEIYNVTIFNTYSEISKFDKCKFFTKRTKPLGLIPYASGIRPKTIIRLNQFYGSSFRSCLLDKMIFDNCDLRNCDFKGASLVDTIFVRVKFNNNTTFDKILKLESRKEQKYSNSAEIYRQLKLTFKENQIIDEAAHYYYREMECKRKSMKLSFTKIRYWLYWVTCGYGEKLWRIAAISGSLWFIFSVLYYYSRINILYNNVNLISFWESMYFSAVTFTTLGYGDFQPIGWMRLIASVEAVLGPVCIALFIVTFSRKAIRD